MARTQGVGVLAPALAISAGVTLMLAVLAAPQLREAPVRSVMGASFPVVDVHAGIDEIIHLLTSKENYAVLVQDGTAIAGILTRYDVIEFMGT